MKDNGVKTGKKETHGRAISSRNKTAFDGTEIKIDLSSVLDTKIVNEGNYQPRQSPLVNRLQILTDTKDFGALLSQLGNYDIYLAERLMDGITEFLKEFDVLYPAMSEKEKGQVVRRVFESAKQALKDDYNRMQRVGIDSLRLEALHRFEAGKHKRYEPRTGVRPSQFLREVYGEYIKLGLIYRPDIRKYDPKLEMALRNEFRGRSEELRALLPNQTDAANAKLEREFGRPLRPEERKAAMTARSIAKRLKTPTR